MQFSIIVRNDDPSFLQFRKLYVLTIPFNLIRVDRVYGSCYITSIYDSAANPAESIIVCNYPGEITVINRSLITTYYHGPMMFG
jgi:hypothetical protein